MSTRIVTPSIKLHSVYQCDECSEEHYLFPPTGDPKNCNDEDCKSQKMTFIGMVLCESFKYEEEGKEPYYIGEAWMETSGIPVCQFCVNRDFEPDYDILEEWLCKEESAEPFTYVCACHDCQEKLGLIKITRAELREQTNGLFEEAEVMADEAAARFRVQYEHERLNYGEEHVLREYHGYTDADFEEAEDGSSIKRS